MDYPVIVLNDNNQMAVESGALGGIKVSLRSFLTDTVYGFERVGGIFRYNPIFVPLSQSSGELDRIQIDIMV